MTKITNELRQAREENHVITPIIRTITEVPFTKEIYSEDTAQVIVKQRGDDHQSTRDRDVYNSGQHRFRFRIKDYHLF